MITPVAKVNSLGEDSLQDLDGHGFVYPLSRNGLAGQAAVIRNVTSGWVRDVPIVDVQDRLRVVRVRYRSWGMTDKEK